MEFLVIFEILWGLLLSLYYAFVALATWIMPEYFSKKVEGEIVLVIANLLFYQFRLPRYCPGNCQFRILNWQDIVLVIAETIYVIKPFRSYYHFWLTRHKPFQCRTNIFVFLKWTIYCSSKYRNHYHIMSFFWREGYIGPVN